MDLCKTSECTGCFACMNVCPKDAISAVTNKMGKTIPHIDTGKCVSCGLCRQVCPEINRPKLKRAEFSYAVWSKNEKDTHLSSSGGAAAVFAEYVIKNGGVVYGCTSCDGTAKHIAIETEEDIDKLRGSKYVQSDVGVIYRDVQLRLNERKTVLFTGTPCQIAGLKNYLRKEYDNLITIDLICHGTPPIAYLKGHIKNKTRDARFNSFSFRGEHDYYLTVYQDNDIIYQKKKDFDEYYTAFYDSLLFRDNCYSCRYARPERVSDITIGDFWGIDRTSLRTPYSGKISVVLPNTVKGTAFFDSCRDGFIYEERSFEEAANPTQGNLLHPSTPHPKRDVFVRYYPKEGFSRAVRKAGIGKAEYMNHILRLAKKINKELHKGLKLFTS